MAHQSALRLRVLHGLRLKGFATTEALAALLELPGDDVERQLAEFRDAGLVLHREGRLTGWSLTPDGRAEHAATIAAELESAGRRADVDAAYRAFLRLNPELLAVCTAWQMVDDTRLNDHSDAGYDAAVVDRLVHLDADLQPVLTRLEDSLDRFAGYRPRFANAVAKLQAGDNDYFAKPMIDSYHTIWFELHEDLLTTLGLERSKEEAVSS